LTKWHIVTQNITYLLHCMAERRFRINSEENWTIKSIIAY